MTSKERYERAARVVIEGLAAKGFTMEKFAQFVRELREKSTSVDFEQSSCSSEKIMKKRLYMQVTRMLQEIGVSPHLKGYRLLHRAISESYQNPLYSESITLYDFLAKEYGTTYTRVERNIRHAIEHAWENGNIEMI